MFYSQENIKKLTTGYNSVEETHQDLVSKYTLFFDTQEYPNYVYNGLLRRMSTLKRCIQNTYMLCPLNQAEGPSDKTLTDITINLQAFSFNTYGCIDNLAWIWVTETQFESKRKHEVSLFNKKIQRKLSEEFREYLNSERLTKWKENLEQFRHSLAHRMPPYIPPFCLTPKKAEDYKKRTNERADFKSNINQTQSENFKPFIVADSETDPPMIQFHAQILADWNTILDLSERLLEELRSKKNQ